MAALDFPAAPAVNDTYSANGRTFTWNGESWLGELNRPLTATTTLDFPAAPAVDDLHQQNGRAWQWNGESWRSLGAFAFEPWDEIARQETIAAGKLTLSGLSLSAYRVVRLYILGVTVTTDDTALNMRWHISGSEISSSDYRYAYTRLAVGLDDVTGSGSGITVTEIPVSSQEATRGVGNASTESYAAVFTIWEPAGSHYKRAYLQAFWTKPDGAPFTFPLGGVQLDNTGPLTGFTVYGSSDLTGGALVLTGVQ